MAPRETRNPYIIDPNNRLHGKYCESVCIKGTRGVSGICPGGLKFFFFPGGGVKPLFGPEYPLKSIDFTGVAGG